MPPNPFSRDPAVNVAVGADTEAFNEGIEGATDRLGSLKNAAGAAGLAIGALGAGAMIKSVQAAADFEEAMVEVEKVTSPETAEEMSGRIRELAGVLPLAQTELAGLAADAGRFGVEGPEAIEKFTETAAKMSIATQLSANEAGESLAKLAELTNTPIDEMENLGSTINSLSQNFATDSQEIVDSMLRASGSLSQLGLNQREIAGLSATLNEVSESSERAGTRLRRLGQELLDPKKATKVADALGLTTKEFKTMRDESPVKLIRMMAKEMGDGGEAADALRETLSTTSRQALSGLGQSLDEVTNSQKIANKSFKENESLQKEVNAQTDTFNSQLKITKNRLRNVAIDIGKILLPVMKDLLDAVGPMITDFREWNNQTDGLAAKMGLAASGVAGLAGAAALLISGPVGVAVGVIGGLTIAAGLLADEFVDVEAVTGRVQDALNSLFTDITESTAFASMSDAADASTSAIRDNINTLDSAIQNQLISPINDADSAFSKSVGSMESEASDHFGMIQEIFNRTVGVALDEFEELTESASETWEDNLSGKNGIVANARTAFNAIWNNVMKPIMNLIQAGWDVFGDDLVTIAEGTFGAIETAVSIAMDGVLSAINIVLDLLSGDFEGAFNTAKDFIFDTVGEIVEYFETDGKQAIKAAISIWLTPFEAIADKLKGAFAYITGRSGGDNDDLDADIKRGLGIRGGSGKNATLASDIQKGLSYIIGTGEGTLIGDIKNGLSYLITVREDSLVGDIASNMADAGKEIGGGVKKAINNVLNLPKEFTVGKIKNPLTGKTVSEGQTLKIPALAEGGLIEESGLAFVDEGERFSGAPGAVGAEVDQSGDMMLGGDELRDAVADGVKRAAEAGALGNEDLARAIEDGVGETTVEFRDQDRYRAVRR